MSIQQVINVMEELKLQYGPQYEVELEIDSNHSEYRTCKSTNIEVTPSGRILICGWDD